MNQTRLARLNDALTSVRYVREWYDSATLPGTLLEALSSWKDDAVTLERALAALDLGGVYLNGVRTKIDCNLVAPCRIELFLPKAHHPERYFNVDELKRCILFEDEFLLGVFKPPGLPSLPTRDQIGANLRAILEAMCGRAVHMPSRLDTSACGVVLVSKSEESHKGLQHAYQFGTAQKTYLLRVDGVPEWGWLSLQNRITRDPSHPILRQVSAEQGVLARSEFLVLERSLETNSSLVKAVPKTGRTHQLRVHTSFLGFPIRGDHFYGGSEAPNLNLMSYQMSVEHPVTRTKLCVKVPPELMPAWAKCS